jgi:hypothetical protein
MVTWAVWRTGLWWDRHRLRRLQYRQETFGDVSDIAIFGAMKRLHQRQMFEPPIW